MTQQADARGAEVLIQRQEEVRNGIIVCARNGMCVGIVERAGVQTLVIEGVLLSRLGEETRRWSK